MALKPRLELRQNQQLALTPRLQQAIRLLQMNGTELADFLAAELEQNPMLALQSPPGSETYPVPGRVAPGDDWTDAAANVSEHVSLFQHVARQIGAAALEPGVAAAALAIAGELSDDGYFAGSLASIAGTLELPAATAARALHFVQSCEPAGIGARNLSECLGLQLSETGALDQVMQVVLDNLDLVAAKAHRELAKKAGCTIAEMKLRLNALTRLDPRPGLLFSALDAIPVRPDIIVGEESTGMLRVYLAAGPTPVLVPNADFVHEITESDPHSRAPLAKLLDRARWLIRTLDRRDRTLLRVAESIVDAQMRYFRDGDLALVPLSMVDIAQQVGMHESTVSRAVTGKYLHSSKGTVPLRHFFGTALTASDGTATHSATAVRQQIRQMITSEAPSGVLTDAQIADVLGRSGIRVARRTIAKYRTAMRIPPAGTRRRAKSGKGF